MTVNVQQLNNNAGCNISNSAIVAAVCICRFPPECVERSNFTHASDVWMFGVFLWELQCGGADPWAGLTNVQVKYCYI